jgi:glycosyltransferase involved in cell wall biosynthesis
VKYGLPERYLFYPADISRHKNQAQIVRAVHALKEERGVDIPIVLCGFRRGSHREEYFTEIQRFVRRKRLQANVHYLDYVPHEDMSALYANAVALVMPTFVGPTTIPVCEAWACGCPVVTSDIRGLREQAGDAALLVDPRSVDGIADAIFSLWTDESLRHTLACRGRQRVAAYTFDDFSCRLDSILAEATARLRSSGRAAVPGA